MNGDDAAIFATFVVVIIEKSHYALFANPKLYTKPRPQMDYKNPQNALDWNRRRD